MHPAILPPGILADQSQHQDANRAHGARSARVPRPGPRRACRRRGPRLAGVPAPLRHRAHLPVPQAAARLDPPEAPRPSRRRPLDWLVIACYAQLYLARALTADLRLPWQRPCPPGRLTPARVRRGFRNLHRTLPVLASAPKPSKPGPGRPPGSKNRRPATRHDVGKNEKPDQPEKKNQQAGKLNKKLRRLMRVDHGVSA